MKFPVLNPGKLSLFISRLFPVFVNTRVVRFISYLLGTISSSIILWNNAVRSNVSVVRTSTVHCWTLVSSSYVSVIAIPGSWVLLWLYVSLYSFISFLYSIVDIIPLKVVLHWLVLWCMLHFFLGCFQWLISLYLIIKIYLC